MSLPDLNIIINKNEEKIKQKRHDNSSKKTAPDTPTLKTNVTHKGRPESTKPSKWNTLASYTGTLKILFPNFEGTRELQYAYDFGNPVSDFID